MTIQSVSPAFFICRIRRIIFRMEAFFAFLSYFHFRSLYLWTLDFCFVYIGDDFILVSNFSEKWLFDFYGTVL